MFRCVHVGAAHAAHMTPITILLVEISQQTREFRLGAADIFLEIVMQPFLGFDDIVPDSSSPATV